ncbi:Uncharacterised protein [Salmonella enterica subsp. enterica serovar Typhi]|nr:Uncharacterised protein [Salmonella enterica subsp. enterica serovar Typhi]CHJ73732.1 Uncharacterised protein [Salmonella enterica subsp. enterica serovar Typhi]CQX29439.1 Uncharacterised protein [Salmonella enterica subsp. enterica serovar Typhi]
MRFGFRQTFFTRCFRQFDDGGGLQFCRFFLCFCPNGQFDRFGFRILRRGDQSDLLGAIRFGGLAGGFYVLLGANRIGQRVVGARFRLRLLLGFGGNGDRFRLVGDFCHLLLFDLFNTYFTLGLNFPGPYCLLTFDLRLLDLPLSKNARLFCFTMALGLKSGNFGVLFGGAGFNLLLLLQSHKGFLLLDFQLAFKRVAVLFAHRHFHILFHFITFTTAAFGFLRQFRQTFGIKGIVWIEMLFGRLVKVG